MNSNPTIDWLRDNAKMIHFFGLGFIQIKINDEYRYHVYHPLLTKITDEEELHNHRYNFHSKILKGRMRQDIYRASWLGSDYEIWEETCEPNSQPSFQAYAACEFITTMVFTSGAEYLLSHDVYHRIIASSCMTLVKRSPHVKERAKVLRPRGTQRVCPFSQQVPEKELWECVEEILKL